MQSTNLREGVLLCAKHFRDQAVTDAGQNMAATAVAEDRAFLSTTRVGSCAA